jgi:hypothetical protein
VTVRCIWCNRDDQSARAVTLPMIDRWGGNPTERTFAVHPEHEEAFRRFARLANRNGRRFIFGVVGTSLAMLVVPMGVIALGLDPRLVRLVVGGGTALIGAMTLVWPFATPETVGMMGIERSARLARVVGGVVVLLGLAIAASVA